MKIPANLLAPLINIVYRLWCRTLIVTESGREQVDAYNDSNKLMVFCMWHGEMFPVIYCKRNLRVVAIVSRSHDGEYLAQVLEKLGFKTARGSSSRGGVAAIMQTAKTMQQENYNACVTIDGPRGPRHVPKPGALYLAHTVPAYIVPLRGFVTRAKIFKSWDRFFLPLPFSRIHVAFGQPYLLEKGLQLEGEVFEKEMKRLKDSMDATMPPDSEFIYE